MFLSSVGESLNSEELCNIGGEKRMQIEVEGGGGSTELYMG